MTYNEVRKIKNHSDVAVCLSLRVASRLKINYDGAEARRVIRKSRV